MKYELTIIGGGPAGVSAGIYAARKKIKTIIIAESFGGQSITSADIQNWIGTKSVSGFDLAQNLEAHLRAQEDIEIKDGVRVEKVERIGESSVASPLPLASEGHGKAMEGKGERFKISLSNGEFIETKYILLTNGSHRRKLGVRGEKELDGHGVAYCSTCDIPLFKNKVVAVVGGGNAGLEGVRDGLPYVSKIYLFVRGEVLRGDPISQAMAKNSDKVEILYNTEIIEILGDKEVVGVKIKNSKTNEVSELKLDGVFIEIGSEPNSDLVKDISGINLNQFKEVVVNHKTQQAAPGIWAAGDISDVLYKQNNISSGDAVKAVLNIYDALHGVDRMKQE
ncbi:MAG: FAD-dependent oxidoreductase [bacterium]|nr:FAD-dependent oxidoreductase [bacterium]